jgi:DNA-binding NtrC family response regulator
MPADLTTQRWKFPRKGGIELLLAQVEQSMLVEALCNAEGVKIKAANLLGISRYALERRLHRLRTIFEDATANAERETSMGR